MTATLYVGPKRLADCNVAVVDDIPESRDAIAPSFLPSVRSATSLSPYEASRKLKSNPDGFDLLVTDLRFIPSDSPQPANGIDLLKSLGAKCPPAVLLSASISGRHLSRIASAAVTPQGTPALRVALKSNRPELMLSQMRGALNDGITASERGEALALLKSPDFGSGEFLMRLENLIAITSEKLQNFCNVYNQSPAALKADCQLEEWPEWKRIKQRVELQLERFNNIDTGRIAGKAPLDTLDALHELKNRIILSDPKEFWPPPEIKSTLSGQQLGFVRALKSAYADFSQHLDQAFEEAEKLCFPKFEFPTRINELLSAQMNSEGIYFGRRENRVKIEIPDPGQHIEQLFTTLSKILPEKLVFYSISFMEEELVPRFQSTAKLRDRLNWGTGFSIRIRTLESEHQGKTWEQLLDPVRSTIEALTARKVFYATASHFSLKIAPGEDSFEFYIKARDVDEFALKQEIERISKISVEPAGSLDIWDEDVAVHKIKTITGEIIAIGCDLQNLRNNGGDYSALLYKDQLILANYGNGHAQNDQAFCYYLVKNLNLPLREAYNLARRFTRMKLESNEFVLATEDEAIRKTLSPFAIDLGLKGVTFSAESFSSRCSLDWMMVEDLEN